MSQFFIDRPVFAWVIGILIMLAGALAILTLPVEQYPDIAPPAVSIRAQYPGASAKTLETTVTQIIEQNLTGIDYLRYFSASSDSSGNVQIDLTFEPEADPDIAQVQVQNKLQRAMPQLPQEVQQLGVNVTKSASSFLLVAAVYSEGGTLTQYDISDYVSSNILDGLSRVNGVGETQLFGQPRSMRIWLNPNKMVSYNLSVSDVRAAVQAQNIEVSAGQFGGLPAVPGQQLNATIVAQTKLTTKEDFENILVRVTPAGGQVLLKDVARIELGAQSYELTARFKGNPAAGVGVKLAPGANALDTADAVKQYLADQKKLMPSGMEISYPYDTTPFVRLSIEGVVHTLAEAIVLVFLVMYLFLQNIRATLIPSIAVPIVLLGTFGVLAAFGFTINTLTMFAMVLAIGLLVDDAIVVVENVERVMHEEKLSPRDATRKSMQQITGALVGIAMVLSAVFIPMAFFSGSTGAIYRQFSITIVSAMALSVVVALVLTPALCATLLKDNATDRKTKGFFGWFNRTFDKGSKKYESSNRHILGRPLRYLVLYAAIVGVMAVLFLRLPTAFLPDEDQGIMFLQITAPPGATAERTLESVKKVEQYFLNEQKDNAKAFFTIVGFNFAGRAQNSAISFVALQDWDKRPGSDRTSFAVAQQAMKDLSKLRDVTVFAINPPAVRELGNAGGFDLQLVDRGGVGHDALAKAQGQLLGMAAQNKNLVGTRPNGLMDVPQYRLDIDLRKASAAGVQITDVNQLLQAAWGSSYINDFVDRGRVKRVYMQGDAPFRMNPDDVGKWYVRNNEGGMVPLSSFTTGHWEFGSPKLQRYNGVPSMQIQGSPAPGVSSGAAMQMIQDMAEKLPDGIDYEWTGLSYEERLAGSQTGTLYAISVLVVFLCLAALYESWSVPFSVILVVPLGILGAVLATTLRGLNNDVYFQVGLLTTVGLAAKNAILIVEFAKDMVDDGMDLMKATLLAAQQRLRPILMTSLAFILGVLPLAIKTGAGSGSQNAIGIGVLGGMLSATFLAIFFVPLLYVAIQKRFGKRNPRHAPIQRGEAQ